MTDGKYKITREVDNKSELDALRKSNAANEKLIATMRQQKKEQRDNEAESKKLQATIVSGIKTAATAIMGGGGLLAAQRLITNELRLQQELQQKNAQAQLTLATAQRGLRANMVGADPAVIADFEERRIPELARKTDVEQKVLTAALSGAVSSAGGDLELAFDSVSQAAAAFGHDAGSLTQISAALTFMSKQLGGDAKSALGLMSLTGSLSPIRDPALQARNIPGGIDAGANLGFGSAESAALFGTVAQVGTDTSGESSRTAMVQFLEQLVEFMKPAKGTTIEQMIETLQQDPSLGRKFATGLTGEARFLGGLRRLILEPQGQIAEGFRFRNQRISRADLPAFADETIGTIRGGRLGPLEAFSRTASEGVESLLTQDTMTGAAGMARTEIPRALAAGPRDSTIQRFRTARAFDVAGDDPEAIVATGINILQQEIRGYRRELTMSRGEPTPLEEKQAATLEGILKALESIRDRTAQIPSAGSAQTNREAGMSQ